MRNVMAKNYRINTIVLNDIIKDLNEPYTLEKTGQSNTIGWILGHIILGRGSVLNLLKVDYQKTDDEERYKRGSVKNNSIKIDLSKAMAEFKKRGTQIEKAIMNLNDAILNEEINSTLPGGGNRIKDAVIFSAWHETFHIGQIDLILAALGKGGIK
jgi:uncharacterized damage-inducible protein DinB